MSTSSTASASSKHPSAGRRASAEEARPGDWIEVEGARGAGPRRGVIEDVLGSGAHTRLRVRWDEKHESLLYPLSGGYIVHAGNPRNSKPTGRSR